MTTTTTVFDPAEALREALLNVEPRECLHLWFEAPYHLRDDPVLLVDDVFRSTYPGHYNDYGTWCTELSVPEDRMLAEYIALAQRLGWRLDERSERSAYLSRSAK